MGCARCGDVRFFEDLAPAEIHRTGEIPEEERHLVRPCSEASHDPSCRVVRGKIEHGTIPPGSSDFTVICADRSHDEACAPYDLEIEGIGTQRVSSVPCGIWAQGPWRPYVKPCPECNGDWRLGRKRPEDAEKAVAAATRAIYEDPRPNLPYSDR